MKSRQSIIAGVLVLLCLGFSSQLYSQIHFSLLTGKKFLATHQVRFGLERSLSFSNVIGADGIRSGLSETDGAEKTKFVRNLDLGLFLDVQLKENSKWYLHTGPMFISGMGAKGIDAYLLDDAVMDSVFNRGSVERVLKYINIPVLLRYKFSSHFFIEAGPRFGLLTKATDIFSELGKEENGLFYKKSITSRCSWLDAGIEGGIGYHLLRGKGVNIGLRYYLGMTDIFSDNASDAVMNKSLSIFLNIPIIFGSVNHEKK